MIVAEAVDSAVALDPTPTVAHISTSKFVHYLTFMVDPPETITGLPSNICNGTINVPLTEVCATTIAPADVTEQDIFDAIFVITVDGQAWTNTKDCAAFNKIRGGERSFLTTVDRGGRRSLWNTYWCNVSNNMKHIQPSMDSWINYLHWFWETLSAMNQSVHELSQKAFSKDCTG